MSREFVDRLTPRDRALFEGLSPAEALAVFGYLFPQGTGARLPLRMRSRAIALYEPALRQEKIRAWPALAGLSLHLL